MSKLLLILLIFGMQAFAFEDLYPRLMPAYIMFPGENKPIEDYIKNSGGVGAIMIAPYELINAYRKVDQSVAFNINSSMIDKIHTQGSLVYIDVSAMWEFNLYGEQRDPAIWSDIDNLLAALKELAKVGLDGVAFDEYSLFGHVDFFEKKYFNKMQSELRAINPYFRIIVSEHRFEDIEIFLNKGIKPDYVALEWYREDVDITRKGCKTIESDYEGVRCALWVDPSTYHHLKESYEIASLTLFWNKCWVSFSSCPPGEYNVYKDWVEWSSVYDEIENHLPDSFSAFEDNSAGEKP